MYKFLLLCGALCSAGGAIIMGISAGSDRSKEEKIGDCLVGLSGILAGIGFGATVATESKKQKEKEEEA